MTKRLATQLMTLAAGLAVAGAACTMNSVEVPDLTGPSELALAFHLTATPDSISQDGVSQSSIVVRATKPDGQPASGQVFRLDMFVGGAAADYGRLSGKTVVTGTDGRASAVYTAPPPVVAGGSVGSCRGLPGPCVEITATPVGTGFSFGNNVQSVDIHLVPLGVILPPADTPTAAFVVTPTPVTANVATNLDASASCGGPVSGGVCNSGNVIVSYSWGFGDGAAGSGKTTSHAWSAPGTYTVVLTVTNDGGKSASTSQTVTVAAGAAPTANFVFSPTSPGIGQQIQFNASQSTAAAGRTLVQYNWNFGDGETQSGVVVNKNYNQTGTFSVTLTVQDDAGQTATVSRTVTVTTGNPVAVLTLVKTAGPPPAGGTISADGSSSFAVSGTIVTYTFSWGDATPDTTGAAPTASHSYAAAGTFTVRLTVTDSLGRIGTITASITVP